MTLGLIWGGETVTMNKQVFRNPLPPPGNINRIACLFFVGCLWVTSSGCNTEQDSPEAGAFTPNAEPLTESEISTESSKPQASASAAVQPPDTVTDRAGELAAIEQLLLDGDLSTAQSKLKSLLLRDPTDAEVIF